MTTKEKKEKEKEHEKAHEGLSLLPHPYFGPPISDFLKLSNQAPPFNGDINALSSQGYLPFNSFSSCVATIHMIVTAA